MMARPARPITEDERTKPCGLCGAEPGERCTNPNGLTYPYGAHRARRIAAPPVDAFGINPGAAIRLRDAAAYRYKERQRQLSTYFNLLMRLCEKAADDHKADLFDRIERVLAEMSRYRVLTLERRHPAA